MIVLFKLATKALPEVSLKLRNSEEIMQPLTALQA